MHIGGQSTAIFVQYNQWFTTTPAFDRFLMCQKYNKFASRCAFSELAQLKLR